ncbi:hypothetical protein BV20DRAFT_948009 [Pilatotrama ljubarskyi]|nr:hypothetical protein BV20DRAFT_948009 [Pilatotrama ljubarskyi]
MSENLSRPNFSAANSCMKNLYFSSALDVLFDAKAIGCTFCTVRPFGRTSVNRCESTAPKPS